MNHGILVQNPGGGRSTSYRLAKIGALDSEAAQCPQLLDEPDAVGVDPPAEGLGKIVIVADINRERAAFRDGPGLLIGSSSKDRRCN
jgi:hypothetical protein